jgi:uncharacterized protein
MKKWLRLGVALALGASGGWAVDWIARYPKTEGYVSDFSQVVDAAGKTQIEAYAASVEQATGARMAFVTIPSLEGEPIEGVAGAIFRGWSTGETRNENGVLLLFSIAEHRFRLEEGHSLAAILPGGLGEDTLRAMRPALRKDDIGDAVAAAAQTVGAAIAEAKHARLTARLPHRRNPPKISDYWNWMPMVGLVALAWLLSRAPGPHAGAGVFGMLPWLLLGNRMGARASYGSRGSGCGMLSGADLLRRLLLDSVSTFCLLFRHALILHGSEGPAAKREVIAAASQRFGFDPLPLEKLLAIRERKLKARGGTGRAPRSVSGSYLRGD